jgi:hypothetical protein
MRATFLALLLCVTAGPVLAQTAGPSTRPPAEAPTPVSPVTVMPPTNKPKVVATWPAGGETITPGVLVLKVVFDQQMTPRDFAYGLGGRRKLELPEDPAPAERQQDLRAAVHDAAGQDLRRRAEPGRARRSRPSATWPKTAPSPARCPSPPEPASPSPSCATPSRPRAWAGWTCRSRKRRKRPGPRPDRQVRKASRTRLVA